MSDRESRRSRRAGRQVAPLTVDRLPDVPSPCDTCIFWEASPAAARRQADAGSPPDRSAVKAGWLTSVMLESGSPGQVVYHAEEPVGYVTYAPAAAVPRVPAFPTAPVPDDALLLVAARVRLGFAGQGIGRVLVHAAAKEALHRGYRAMEAFGAVDPASPCVLPAGFLAAVGFQTVRDHPVFPRLRLDLRTALAWRDEVEHAVERILGPIRAWRPEPAGVQPAGSVQPAHVR